MKAIAAETMIYIDIYHLNWGKHIVKQVILSFCLLDCPKPIKSWTCYILPQLAT
jgi:hypothetical protein